MSAPRRKVHPALRLAAIVIGAASFVVGLIMVFLFFGDFHWDLAVRAVSGLVIGSFFIFVGITGTNYYLKSEHDDEQG